MSDKMLRVCVLILGAIYWVGVLSGYYAAHGPYLNSNPNTFINPGIGVLSILVAVRWIREKRAQTKLETL